MVRRALSKALAVIHRLSPNAFLCHSPVRKLHVSFSIPGEAHDRYRQSCCRSDRSLRCGRAHGSRRSHQRMVAVSATALAELRHELRTALRAYLGRGRHLLTIEPDGSGGYAGHLRRSEFSVSGLERLQIQRRQVSRSRTPSSPTSAGFGMAPMRKK
jgi:hypothetical protein